MLIPIGNYQTSIGTHDFEIESFRHTLITGKSGTGKSSLLSNLAIEHIRAGHGILFIDPHGDAADHILRFIPKHRSRDVIFIDPLAKKVPGLNIFDYAQEDDRERAVQSFITMMKSLSGEGWGPETERILTQAADAIVEHHPHPSVIQIYLFIARQSFRKKILGRSKNPALQDFLEQYDKDLRTSERMSKFSPPLNKTDKFIRPVLRTIMGQESSLDFKDAMDSKKIILCKLSKGRLGAVVSSIIGSVIVSHVSISSLQRKSNRTPFVVFIDEVHNFVHGIDFPTILAETRKYGITLVLATQNVAQLPYPDDVFGNCSNLITFRIGGEDAKRIARELGSEDIAQSIVGLPDFTFSASTVRDGLPILGEHIYANYPLSLRGDESHWRDVIKTSRMRYGKNRLDIDRSILRFLSQ